MSTSTYSSSDTIFNPYLFVPSVLPFLPLPLFLFFLLVVFVFPPFLRSPSFLLFFVFSASLLIIFSSSFVILFLCFLPFSTSALFSFLHLPPFLHPTSFFPVHFRPFSAPFATVISPFHVPHILSFRLFPSCFSCLFFLCIHSLFSIFSVSAPDSVSAYLFFFLLFSLFFFLLFFFSDRFSLSSTFFFVKSFFFFFRCFSGVVVFFCLCNSISLASFPLSRFFPPIFPIPICPLHRCLSRAAELLCAWD